MLKTILPENGYLIAWILYPSGASSHEFFDTVEAFEAALPRLDKGTNQVYFFVGSLKENVGVGKGCKPRAEENILGYKTLWMDVDTGKPNSHATVPEAAAKLKEFFEAVNWPAPMVVSSGNGLHMYWPLMQMISIEQWRAIAPAILAAATHVGLKIDAACNNKASQVLRPAGTHHKKDMSNQKLVRVVREGTPAPYEVLLANIRRYVEDNKLPLIPMATHNAPSPFVQMMLKARPGMTYNPPREPVVDRDVKAILTGCKQMRLGLQHDLDQPTWYAMITVCAFLPQGRELAHKLSGDGNDKILGYDPAEVDRKFDQALDAGPSGCSTFQRNNPDGCESCPNAHKVKNPITLGNRVSEVIIPPAKPIVAPEILPTTDVPAGALVGLLHPPAVMDESGAPLKAQQVFPYEVNANGIFDNEGAMVTASQVYGLGSIERVSGLENVTYSYMFRVITPRGKINDVTVAGGELTSEKAAQVIAEFGVNTPNKKALQQLGHFMRAQTQLLEKEEPTQMHTTLGWQDDGCFVNGYHTVRPDGSVIKSQLDGAALEKVSGGMYTPKGELSKWVEAARVFNDKDQLHSQFAVCASFGSALMQFSGEPGVTVSLHGVSGIGKSSIQRVIAAIWADPVRTVHAKPATDSGTSLISLAESTATCKSLPLLMDEMTVVSNERVVEIVNVITGGIEKTRMVALKNGSTSSSGMSSTVARSWACIGIATTNTLLRDMVVQGKRGDATPDSYRIFELAHLKPVSSNQGRRREDGRRIDEVKYNYGHAGLTFARYLVTNKDKLAKWIDAAMVEIGDRVNDQQPERYWLRACAVTLVSSRIAKAAGLIAYDTDVLLDYIVAQYLNQRVLAADVADTAEDQFSRMISEMQPYALIVGESQESPDPSEPPVPLVTMPKSGVIHMRIDTVSGIGYIASTAVTKWANDNRVSRSALIKAGLDTNVLHSAKANAYALATHAKGVPNQKVKVLKIALSVDEVVRYKEHADILKSEQEGAK